MSERRRIDPAETGAAAILRTLADAGVTHLFANPGTTELAFVSALPTVASLAAVLVVDETVASGAADGAARMSDRPGATLLHLGPGLANAGANLHNAIKARSPIVTLVGDHASDHRHLPSPLQSDIEAIAAPFSLGVDVTRSAADAGPAAVEAVATSVARRGPVTLVVPADHATDAADQADTASRADAVRSSVDSHVPRRAEQVAPAVHVDEAMLRDVAELLAGGGAALFLGGRALRADTLALADRLADAVGADLWAPMFNGRVERTRPTARPLRKLPYFPAQAHAVLGGYRVVVSIDTDEPLAMFAYPGEPRRLLPDHVVHRSLRPRLEDVAGVLERLVALVDAPPLVGRPLVAERPTAPDAASLDPMLLAACVAATLPDHAVVVDEAQTSSIGLWDGLASVPHDLLMLTGGAIGSGPPLAVGAALAAPGRRVVNVEGDGSILYSLAALWTQARHSLDVTTVVAVNRRYAILDLELARAGDRSNAAGPLTSLTAPTVDHVALASGFGVPAVRVDSAAGLSRELARSFATEGPMLIEACW